MSSNRGGGFGYWWLFGNLIGRASPQERKGYTESTEIVIVLKQTLWGTVLSEILTLIALYLASRIRVTFTHEPYSAWQHLRWIWHYFATWFWIPGPAISCVIGAIRMWAELFNPYYQQHRWISSMIKKIGPAPASAGAAGAPAEIPIAFLEGMSDDEAVNFWEGQGTE